MATLQEKLLEQLPKKQKEIRQLVKEHGDKVISEVTITQAFGGMRGVKALVCDTSLVEPDKGLIIRGTSVLDLVDKLPEEIFYLLLTGELPDAAALKSLQKDLRDREEVPGYVWDVLDAMSKDAHPMTMLSTAVLVMQRDSVFAKKYREGIPKTEYWQPVWKMPFNFSLVCHPLPLVFIGNGLTKGQESHPNLIWIGPAILHT